MFFFLSKFLPLLIYPLGLSCLLLLIALVSLWKFPRRSLFAIATALLILFCSSNPLIAVTFVKTLEWQYLPLDPVPAAEVIVVLGGSTRAQSPPRPWVEVLEAGDRILYGVKLYKEGVAPSILFSGGRVSWQGNEGGSEAQDMAAIAKTMGVPERSIVLENVSLNTYQNAVETAKILRQKKITNILLVTSAIHMPRSVAIFEKQGFDVTPAPTDYWVAQESLDQMRGISPGTFLNVLPDTEALHFFTRALKEYIGLGIYRLRGWL
ncbi:YdcF family protein [Leptolyngbyaceae cyanobacterium CCMR0082]|uniref:YdcF family protein n=2 Tax=Adonisia turfae TaxID=2950184 RepID=A0A6M0S5A8_9CYAN|nr:YdcF family protein [Adonisia turfae]MDV3353421.1 YdcF family protein [Leptothoe sp. LEGE 181152]NEZ60594.1 YdcF family protein [Adonisia turfae CCMR0081]NEZ63689.1 YdcF family protein [Adonisia turfae CCMR0082]